MAPRRLDPSATFADSYIAESVAASAARSAAADLKLATITPAAARTLTLLARLTGARSVVEVGTGAGVSGLALFAGMTDDGVLTSIDIEPEHHMAARESFRTAGLAHQRYRLIAGDAMTVLPRLTSSGYDLVFIDADILQYPEYIDEALRLTRSGGAVVMNHALLAGKVADPENFDDDTMIIRDALEAAQAMTSLTRALLPIGDGLLVIVV